MKIFTFTILCTSSLLFSAPSIADEREDTPLDLKYSQQIGAIDPNIIMQQPISSEQILLNRPTFEPRYKSPSLAVGLSALFPGLGHVYLGDMKTAGGLIGSSGAGIGSTLYSKHASRYGVEAIATAWMYGIYSAYRDARIINGPSHYSYKMPTDDFIDLSLAPFRWSVIKKPEVWGGFLGTFALAVGASLLYKNKELHVQSILSSKGKSYPLFAFPVGLSEESLFRGYLQSQLSELFTPLGGIALSSLIFGAMHVPNGWVLEPEYRKDYFSFSIPFIISTGAYMGWLTYKNHSLKESVALHAWYDFVIMGLGALAGQAASTGCSRFDFAFSF